MAYEPDFPIDPNARQPDAPSGGVFGSSGNNVWDSVKSLGESYIKGAVAVAGIKANAANLRVLSTAAPSGALDRYLTSNPLPGGFGTNPQAQTKPTVGGSALQEITSNPLIWAIVILMGIVAVLRFR